MSKTARVPGTFKDRPAAPRRDSSVQGRFAEGMLLDIGALSAERWLIGDCSVMIAREPYQQGHRWHLSISHPTRYPTWDEIKTAVYGIPTAALPDGRTYAQLLGPVDEGEWVNVADNCFHLYEIEAPLL